MRETEWVELVANAIRPELVGTEHSFKIKTQAKIPYSYEIRAYREEPETEAISFATDFLVVEESPDGSWKPRVVAEAKVGSVTTHDGSLIVKKQPITDPFFLICATASCWDPGSITPCQEGFIDMALNSTS